MMNELYKLAIQSVLVEGGAKLLQSFTDADSWDEARVITGNKILQNGIPAPRFSSKLAATQQSGDDVIQFYYNN